MFSAAKTSAPVSGAYTLSKSVRLRSSASGNFSRTPSVAGNQQKWTISFWIKLGYFTDYNMIFGSTTSYIAMTPAYNFRVVLNNGSGYYVTNAVYVDYSSWYHIVVSCDTTQATASNRLLIYINGVQVTNFSTNTQVPQNTNTGINNTVQQGIGFWPSNGFYLNSYLADFYLVDGQQLTPSSFGSTNATTGQWSPAKYTGTYGTNGFHLTFANTTSTTTLGYDTSGNANNWTTNNISLTAGATYDSMNDVPVAYSATAANYCVLNPNDKDANLTFSNGNLSAVGYNAGGAGSFGLTANKWYWEVTLVDPYGVDNWGFHGVSSGRSNLYVPGYTGYPNGAGIWALANSGGGTWANGSAVYGYTTFANGDVIGFAFDATNLTLDVYRNNTKIGTTLTVPSSAIYPSLYQSGTSGDTSATNYNFGQQPFTYTPPSGYKALNTYNLPTPTIAQGNKYMDATLYTGNGSTQSITNAGAFKPDLVWIKSRSASTDNKLTDSVRGTTKALISNTTGAETTDTNGLTAFNSNGFTIGTDTNYNNSGVTYVAWQWQAGAGSSSSNTNGTITSTVSVSTTAGFSVVSYTGTATANQTVGHGLGVAPSLIIVKQRTNAGTNWVVYTPILGKDQLLILNQTAAVASVTSYWGTSAPNSTVFGVGQGTYDNNDAAAMIAYCFAPVAGFSAFGSWTGTGVAPGPFIYCGFQPRFILSKRTDTAGNNWMIIDTARNPYNVTGSELYPSSNNNELTGYSDFNVTSNGFQVAATYSYINASGGTYIYAAFASNPFAYSNAF